MDAPARRRGTIAAVTRTTFHSGSTLIPFISSGLLLGFLAFWAAVANLSEPHPSGATWFYVAFFVFFGPVISTVQIARWFRTWVRIEPNEGLAFPDGKIIPWTEIGHVERYPGIFSYADRLERRPQDSGLLLLIGTGCLVCPVLVVYYVFLPVLLVLSPWPSRVTIYLKNGGKIVLRDLGKARSFVEMVEAQVDLHAAKP